MAEYIAREALDAEIRRQIDECKPMSEGRFYGASFLATIECAPAADVAEVVHGRWVFTNAGWKCNLCGHSMPYWPMASTQERTNYCPNCGAKMDKEDET